MTYSIDYLLNELNLADSVVLASNTPLDAYLLALNISIVCKEQLANLGLLIN